MQFARDRDPDRLSAYLESVRHAPLSYSEVGASLGDRPEGYRHDSDVITLGSGSDAFARATQGLREWRAHLGAGVTVFLPTAPLEVDTTVALALPLPGITALAACRIVAVVDEPDRFGFAYGTIVGHPEQGEEAFLVERHGDEVQFRIDAFSRTRDLLARLGSPVARHIQRRVTRGYLTALQTFVTG